MTIAALHGFAPILLMTTAGSVTVQDLDLIRHVTNFEDLVRLDHCTNVVIQRCRIGSDWSTAGLASAANLRVIQPKHNVIRNCLCFSAVAGHFERGISVEMASAMDRSVLLYHNVVADHDGDGIYLQADGDCYAVLRNNVIVNRATLNPEPDAIHSIVTLLVTVDSSHNTAFATAAHVEEQGGAQAVQGTDLLRFEPIRVGEAFHKFEWVTDPAWDPNFNFFRLMDGGLMRREVSDEGTRVAAGQPGERDEAVTNDWERDPRPDSDDERTDRGADQVAHLTVGDVWVTLPRIPSFIGRSFGGTGSHQYEIIAVGPQDDFPVFDTPMMSGGEYRISGHFTSIAALTSTPPELPRSTFFDGSAGAVVRFQALPGVNTNLAMTIEAWVYREDPARTEAILAQDRSTSFWFGFVGPRLRFYRSGSQFADSTGTVAGRRWTHVAAAYNGSQVEFFIDGKPAGSQTLGSSGPLPADSVYLGGDATGANFRGFLDEVRFWSVRRTEEEIRGAMFSPISPRAGLQALFPSGGPWEAVAGIAGEFGPGVADGRFGVLPRELRIPRALFPKTLSADGQINLGSEYLGAEQVVIRYDEGPDAVAHLVHRGGDDDPALFIAVTGLRNVPPGRDPSNSCVSVMVDGNRSQDAVPNVFDFQLRGYFATKLPELWLGNNVAGFDYSSTLQFLPGFSAGVIYPDEFGAPWVEFRIARSQLGEWHETDGFAFGHFGLAAEGDDFLAPAGARANSPATWVPGRYVSNPAEAARVFVVVEIEDQAGSRLGEHEVRLLDETGNLIHSVTPQSGSITFAGFPVPPDQEFQVQVVGCDGCRFLDPVVENVQRQPIRINPDRVIYRLGRAQDYFLANVTFRLHEPAGAVSLASFYPAEGLPALILREQPLQQLTGDIIRIRGQNLHDLIQVYLYGCLDLEANTGPSVPLGCIAGEDYFEARIQARAPDETWVDVEVPHVPRASWAPSGWWGWVVKDNWDRPDRAGAVWTRVGGAPNNHFNLRMSYPLVFGFEFDNEEFAARVDDYESTFRGNAYASCLDLGDTCACLEASPGFLSLFRDLITDSGGSCVGMAATSLLMARENLPVNTAGLNSDANASGINFPAGFTDQPGSVHVENDCGPASPRNLRARIRANHGVQFSIEFLDEALAQMDDPPPSISANPMQVLDRVGADLDEFIICLVPELGRGHAVTPYAVERGVRPDGTPDAGVNLIRIYDNNYPEDTTRLIEVFAPSGDFPHGSYRFQFADGETWTGAGLFAMPISLFLGERNPPDILDAIEFLWAIVAGGADGLYRDGQGGEVGWRADGTTVDQFYGARAMVPLGALASRTRHVPFAFPATNPPPTVQINVRSNHYVFRAANAGRFLQLNGTTASPAARIRSRCRWKRDALAGLRHTPQHEATEVVVRGALFTRRWTTGDIRLV